MTDTLLKQSGLVSRRPSAGTIWWLSSVPYALGFGLFLAIFPEYAWTILHSFVPLLLLYWVTYYSSLVWLAIFVWLSVLKGGWGLSSILRLVVGAVAIVVPLVFSHGWPGF